MKKKILAVILGMTIGATANAAGPTVPHSFQSGQKAVASEVNANFQNLADRIDDLSVRIDGLPGGTVLNLSDFSQADNITGKSFQISNNANGCTADNRTYTKNVVGDTTTIVETVVGTSAGGATPCSHVTNTLERNPTGLRVAKVDTRTPDGATLTDSVTFIPAQLYLPAQLSKGSTWSGETVLTRSSGATVFLAQHTLIGLENVTVPKGTFNNCLKTYRSSVAGTGSSTARVEWRCPGMGLVKQIDTFAGISELVTTSP